MISKATLKTIDPIVRKVSNGSLYTSYELKEQEFVGTISHRNPNEVDYLRNSGYESPPRKLGIPLQAVKTHHKTGAVHHLALRKVPTEKPEIVDGTKLMGFRSNQLQYHIHLFIDASCYAVASHLETRPDLTLLEGESPEYAITRIQEHLNPTWDKPENDLSEWSYLRGVMDPALEGLLG